VLLPARQIRHQNKSLEAQRDAAVGRLRIACDAGDLAACNSVVQILSGEARAEAEAEEARRARLIALGQALSNDSTSPDDLSFHCETSMISGMWGPSFDCEEQ
jgi:hypothetical protein